MVITRPSSMANNQEICPPVRSNIFKARKDLLITTFYRDYNLILSRGVAITLTSLSFANEKRFKTWESVFKEIGGESDRKIRLALPEINVFGQYEVESISKKELILGLKGPRFLSNLGLYRAINIKAKYLNELLYEISIRAESKKKKPPEFQPVQVQIDQVSAVSPNGQNDSVMKNDLFKRAGQYLQESRIFTLKRRDREGRIREVDVEMVVNPTNKMRDNMEQAIEDMTDVLIASLEGKVLGQIEREKISELVEKRYFGKAERIAFIRSNGKVLGFTSLTREVVDGQELISLSSTYLHPSIKGFSFSRIINYCILNEKLDDIKSKRFKGVLFTASPRVVGEIQNFSNVYPDPFDPANSIPDRIKVFVKKALSQRLGAEAVAQKFDQDTFVIKGDFKRVFGFTYDPEQIELHENERVNTFCFDRLKHINGDAMVIYYEASRWTKYRFILNDFVDRMQKYAIFIQKSIRRLLFIH